MSNPLGSAPPPSFPETKNASQDDNNKEKILTSLTLLVDKHLNKVLGAEAGKDFVDLLFGLLHLPLGSIIGLLQKHGMQVSVGSIGIVFGSIEKMDLSYFHSQAVKESLMLPQVAVSHPLLPQNNFSALRRESQGGSSISLGGFGSIPSASSSTFGALPFGASSSTFGTSPFGASSSTFGTSPFGASSSTLGFGSVPSASSSTFCTSPFDASSSTFGSSWSSHFSTPTTSFSISQEAATSSLAGKEVMGFVNEGNTKFMVEDNLKVTPISLETLFNAIGARDSSSLERRIVKISFKKSLEIVKALFESDTVLTDVFIGKNLPSKKDPIII